MLAQGSITTSQPWETPFGWPLPHLRSAAPTLAPKLDQGAFVHRFKLFHHWRQSWMIYHLFLPVIGRWIFSKSFAEKLIKDCPYVTRSRKMYNFLPQHDVLQSLSLRYCIIAPQLITENATNCTSRIGLSLFEQSLPTQILIPQKVNVNQISLGSTL